MVWDLLFVQKLSVNGNSNNPERKRLFYSHRKSAAAGNLHPQDGHAADRILPKNRRQLLTVIYRMCLMP